MSIRPVFARVCRPATRLLSVSLLFFTILFAPPVFRVSASDDKAGADRKTIAPVEVSAFRVADTGKYSVLSWETAYENGVVGFDIWAVEGDVPKRITNVSVPAAGLKTSDGVLPAGDAYRFRTETSVEAAYWLEARLFSGESRWYGPAVRIFGTAETPLEDVDSIPANREFPGSVERAEFTPEKSGPTSESFLDAGFTGSGSALKVEVRERGWHRISSQVLSQNGFPTSTSATWKLYNGAREEPIVVNADGSVDFYGTGLDTIQTDRRVYWLVGGGANGKRIARSTQKYSQSIQSGWARFVAERRDRAMRVSGVLNGARENWYSSYVATTDVVQTLNLSEIATESNETATIGVDLQGIGSGAHQVLVFLNGIQVGRVDFADYQRTEWTLAVSASTLRNGANEIRLRSPVANDWSLLEAVRINYPRRLRAQSNRLDFSLPARRAVKLTGFNSPVVRVFNVTNPEATAEIRPATRLESDGTYSATISSSSSVRNLIAVADNAVPFDPVSAVLNVPSDLKNTQNRAALLIIAPPAFAAAFEPLRLARETQGLGTMVVDPVDIYDEFSYGVRSADAIRTFLQYAKQNWAGGPSFVMLGGDASSDPRNFSGTGGPSADVVPTVFVDTWNIEAASDAMLADFNGDSVEDIAVGRLPVRTTAELAAVVEKILRHDTFTNSQIMQRGVLFVSDAFIGYDFATGSRNIAQPIPTDVNRIYTDASSADAATVRQAVLNTMNGGPAVVNYFGHASVMFWTGNQIYRASDAGSLVNYTQPSFHVMLACLNGTFAEGSIDSLSEATLKSASGGAFGIWASTALNGAYEEELMGRDFHGRLFAGQTIGDAARQAKAAYSVDVRRTFVLFGDPSQKLIK